MRWMLKHITILGGLLLFLSGCSSHQKLHNANLAHLYQQEGVVLKPMFRVYHVDESITQVFMQASSDQLLYVKDSEDGQFKAKLKIEFQLYDSFENSTVLDSGSVMINDTKPNERTKIIFEEFQFNSKQAAHGDQFVLRIILTDVNRKLSYENLINIDRGDAQNRQNFLMKSASNHVKFINFVAIDEAFTLGNNQGGETYKVRYYDREFPLALPPYSANNSMQFKYAADSLFTISQTDTFSFKKHGFYHFQINDKNKEGYTVFCFEYDFPLVTQKLQLGGPLRYLTNNSEFKEIEETTDKDSLKYIVDKFWLKSAGSVSKGKYLVNSYYSRVQDANIFFTSYLEGWKTDRGIVYVMLGPPSKVIRSSSSETWVYGNESSSLDMVFNFAKVYNPFTNNDYALSRLNKYRYIWGQAVDAWRHGTAYSVKEIIKAQDERDQQLRATAPPNFWY